MIWPLWFTGKKVSNSQDQILMVRYRGVGTPCYDSLKRYFLLCLNLGQKWFWTFTPVVISHRLFCYLFPKLHTVETSSDSNVWFLTSQLVFWKLQQVFTSRQYCSVVNFSPDCIKFCSKLWMIILLADDAVYLFHFYIFTDRNNLVNLAIQVT